MLMHHTGFHPQRFGIAKRLHIHATDPAYLYNNSVHTSLIVCDIIHIHSQLLMAFIVVKSPPLINMLKFNGRTLTVHGTTSFNSHHNRCELEML